MEMEARRDFHIRVRLPLRHSGVTESGVNTMMAGDMSKMTVDVALSVVMSEDRNTSKEIWKRVGKEAEKEVGKGRRGGWRCSPLDEKIGRHGCLQARRNGLQNRTISKSVRFLPGKSRQRLGVRYYGSPGFRRGSLQDLGS